MSHYVTVKKTITFDSQIISVTHLELFWVDQYIHRTHEGVIMVGVDL